MRRRLLLLLLAACSAEQNLAPLDLDLNRMIEQPRYDPWEASPFFDDGMAMRSPPPGAVPRELEDPASPPAIIDAELLAEGRRAYDIHCAPCHGIDGQSGTVVAANMHLVRPPSFHLPTLRDRSALHYYRAITYGFGMMPAYGWRVGERERWAIVAWVRALQRSRAAALDDLPPEMQARAREALGP